MLENGLKAPDFCLPNQDDVEICLRDLVGKWVVLYFYPKDNTPGCSTEACDFTHEIEAFEELNAVILGVSPDNTKKHLNFIAKKELKITLLSDEEKQVIKKYNAWGPKKMMGKVYLGVIRTTYIIAPDGKIAFGWSKVKVKNHIKDVKNKLKELQN